MPEPITILLTVNPHETDAVLDAFVGSDGRPTRETRNGITYNHLGVHGGNRVIHVISEMGTGGLGASHDRTDDCIRHWNPVAVIAVGIAFGVDEEKQKIGEVLVSTRVVDYELARLNADGSLTHRGAQPDCGPVLLNRFRTMDATERRRANWPVHHLGTVLSGQKLVDNHAFREALKARFEGAIGGEMEGSGVYAAAQKGKVEWIIVKAICDWAHDKNSANKDQWQKLAAKNAATVVKAALEAGPMTDGGRRDKGSKKFPTPKPPKTASPPSKSTPPTSQMQIKLATPTDMRAESDQLIALLGQSDPLKIDKRQISLAAVACRDHTQLQAPWPTKAPALGQLMIILLWWELGPKTADGLSGALVSLVKRACQSSLAEGTQVLLCQCQRPLQVQPPADIAQFAEFVENLKAVRTFCSHMQSAPPTNLRWVEFEQVDQLLPEIHAELEEIARQSMAREANKASASAGKRTTHAVTISLQDEELKAVQAAYLDWMIDAHDQLELRSIGGVTPLTTIPLEDVYVALRGVKAPAHERHQARLLHLKELRQELLQERQELALEDYYQMMLQAEEAALMQHPLMPQLSERDPQNSPEISISLAEAFREERWMVILGDPGSGKTTLLRWLTRSLAKTLHPAPRERVIVRACHVDPAASRSSDTTVDLGPARLPVLLRISEYSDALSTAKKRGQSLEIVDFLGHHTWPNAPTSMVDSDKLNTLIRLHLRRGTAVVLLDGMDEVTETSQRSEVVHAIERFIARWINGRGEALATRWPVATTPPWQQGGNQIVISSRIAGYHAHGIDGPVSHLTVQPMQKQAIEQFCEAWCAAAAELMFPQNRERAQAQGAEEAEGLKKEIFNANSPQLWEIASNPLMITIIALIYRKQQGRLPAQRSQLYHEALRILIEEWRSSGIKTDEFIMVLAPLAALMHEQYSTGLVPEEVLQEVIARELVVIRKPRTKRSKLQIDREVNCFCAQLSSVVGLLAERGTGLYGFLHLTFQEYLAGLWLVREPDKAGQALVNHLADPRWREPILLALGHVNTNKHWGPEAQENLLRRILHADDPLSDLIPRGPLLVVRALPEMHNVSDAMVQEILSRLLRSYTLPAEGQLASVLRQQIERAVKRLHDSGHRPRVWQSFARMLRVRQPEDVAQAIACAHLIWANQWSPPAEVVKALLRLQLHDDIQWSWPVTNLVRGMCGPALDDAEAAAAKAVSAWESVVAQLSPAKIAEEEQAIVKRLADVQKELSEVEQHLTAEAAS